MQLQHKDDHEKRSDDKTRKACTNSAEKHTNVIERSILIECRNGAKRNTDDCGERERQDTELSCLLNAATEDIGHRPVSFLKRHPQVAVYEVSKEERILLVDRLVEMVAPVQ